MEHGVKKEGFLRLIIIQKLSTGAVELVLSAGAISFLNRDLESITLNAAAYLNLDVENRSIQLLIRKAGMISNGTILGVSGGLLLFGVLALTEGWGLHMRRRWAEWLTVISTSSFIPFEIYEIIKNISIIKTGTLILNCAIVYYLVKHKELFKKKTPPDPSEGWVPRAP
ncbi:MAG: DUF2127 domain-containing protein [Deltaproteobacteria bacterium]|nr:DUF2127 domain-containing protein [Deltaproteobacteria bacterium]